MSDQTIDQTAICGEVGTSFTADHEPHYTDPCLLPADHDELHDWAQREAVGEPSPAETADRLATVTRERDEARQDVQSVTDDLDAVRIERDRLTAELDQRDSTISSLRDDLEFQTKAAFANQAAVDRLAASLDAVREVAYRQQQAGPINVDAEDIARLQEVRHV